MTGIGCAAERRATTASRRAGRACSWMTDVSGVADLPTNRHVADRLGWTITKFNRKLDTLCVKFEKLGVAGLRGEQSAVGLVET